MSIVDDPKFKRYFVQGFVHDDDAQSPPGQDGDPQLAALSAFLQTFSSEISQEEAILDIGSGRGVLAHIMLRVWADDAVRPWYYAADLPEDLETLNLPRTIHNKSRKILISELIELSQLNNPPKIKLAVIRNVFHHLHIRETAEMLLVLRDITATGATAYIQDMVILPKGERTNTGWPTSIFVNLVNAFGFACINPVEHRSRSGTFWSSLILREAPSALKPNRAQAEQLVLRAREAQLEQRTAELRALAPSDDTTVDYFILSEEVATLSSQVQAYRSSNTAARTSSRAAGLPVKPYSTSGFDYVEEIKSNTTMISGLTAIISSKAMIDLPALIDQTLARLWFAGYSQRILFSNSDVRQALLRAVERGVDLRILIVDPESHAAQARGLSDAYGSPQELVSDIRETMEAFDLFSDELRTRSGGSARPETSELRLFQSIVSSSFFITDNTCLCSLYSSNLTGGAGPTFVLKSPDGNVNNYFRALLREFQGTWLKSKKHP